MSSMIVSGIASLWKRFADIFKKSGICALLLGIYNFFSASWKNSRIMTVLRSSRREGEAQKSVTAKILRLPFSICERIGALVGDFINERIKKSVICAWSKTYIQSFMAVNTRFFGFMLLFSGAVFTVLKLTRAHYVSRAGLIIIIAGIALSLVNYNVMRFLGASRVVDFVKACMGFDKIEFTFFDEYEAGKRLRLFLAAAAGAVTGAAAYVSPLLGAAVPFLLFGMLLVMYAPVTGVYAAVFFAPLVPTMALAAICLWTALSLVIHSLSDRNFKWQLEAVGIGIMLLLIVLLVSSLLSFAVLGSLKVWAMYFVFAGFFLIIINTVKTKEQLYGLLRVFVISAALVALYGVLQYIFGWTTTNAWIDEGMFEEDTMRVYSTLANPNVLGEFLLLALPAAAVWMIKDSWKKLSKWCYIAVFLLLALCLVLTQSRGCWIGFILGAAIFVTFYEGKWWGLLPIVILLLPLAVPQTVVERIASVGNMDDSSTSYRVYIWMGTIGLLKHYWLGGIGMGEAAFRQVYPFFSYNAIVAPHSHNTFLQLTVEAGIGALMVFLVTDIVFLHNMYTVYKKSRKKSVDWALSLAIGCGVSAFLVQSMFDYTFYNYRVMCIFFMFMAMGISLKLIKDGRVRNE